MLRGFGNTRVNLPKPSVECELQSLNAAKPRSAILGGFDATFSDRFLPTRRNRTTGAWVTSWPVLRHD